MDKHVSKSGQEPGKAEPIPPEQKQGRKSDVKEEDIFGGAERTDKGGDVKSPHAKP